MVDHDDVVTCGVNVQFDTVRALFDSCSEGRDGVLVMLAGGATMGDDEGSGNWWVPWFS